MVGQRRQAWCPRCDEVRTARPASPCQSCSAPMVALPRASKGPSPGGRAELARRLRSLLPAARMAGTAVVAAALIAGAFAAGRSSGASSAASAATTSTTVAEPDGRALPGGGRSTDVSRVFGWRSLHGGVSVTLNRVTASGSSTRVQFEASGLGPGWSFAGVQGIRLTDAAGHELASGLPGDPLLVDEPVNLGGGSTAGTVELATRVDPNDVGGVTVTRLLAMRQSGERLRGTLLDAELKRAMDTNPETNLDRDGPCPACTLEVRCVDCETVKVAGWTYSGGRVQVVLAEATRLAPGETLEGLDVTVAAGSLGQIGSFQASSDDGDTVVQFNARDLASLTLQGQTRMSFVVDATIVHGQVRGGPWRIDQRSGLR